MPIRRDTGWSSNAMRENSGGISMIASAGWFSWWRLRWFCSLRTDVFFIRRAIREKPCARNSGEDRRGCWRKARSCETRMKRPFTVTDTAKTEQWLSRLLPDLFARGRARREGTLAGDGSVTPRPCSPSPTRTLCRRK